jgi:predicted CopG family antitoxin
MSEIKKKRKKKTKNQYFTQATEDAIVRYNNSIDPEERSRIYRDDIHYAFFKLTENIIHTFKFYYTEVDEIEHLQHEVITFLLSKIHLFDQSKGAKAFSYFGTIAKRYLIIQNTKNYKKRVDKAPVEELYHNDQYSYDIDYNPLEKDHLSDFIDEYVEYCSENIFEIFPKQKDAQVADAILELFRKREIMDIFNKKALYLLIREMVDVKTPHITRIATKLGDIFKKHFLFYQENGYTNFE